EAEAGIRERTVAGVQTCALPIWERPPSAFAARRPYPPDPGADRRVPQAEAGRSPQLLDWVAEARAQTYDQWRSPVKFPDCVADQIGRASRREEDRGPMPDEVQTE